MKARELKKILNNTRYLVSNGEERIKVGSSMCPDLISVDKKTLRLKYALDYKKIGREELFDKDNNELLAIWDKLQELIDSGAIHEIINGNDDIEHPLPVFTFYRGKLVETFTDAYGWPNTTVSGETMYENTHFKTATVALQYGIVEYKAGIKLDTAQLEDLEKRVAEIKSRIATYQEYVAGFKQELEKRLQAGNEQHPDTTDSTDKDGKGK